jgi:2-C-methyl-D-erythritol 4-phosphate cytidylyltransferase/2-C-methyl-D-erythritol 2,4-cyclodiphosphate synthase
MTERDAGVFAAIVVAAGSSKRFGGGTPKQFLDLGGSSVLRRSTDVLAGAPGVDRVVVALAPEEIGDARAAEVASWPGVSAVVAGGKTRAGSVRNGLLALDGESYVLVHDAARPLASPALVAAVIEGTRRHGAAVPGIGVSDTVKRVDADGNVIETLDRRLIRLAQTPQGARTDWLIEALGRRPDLTDEAAALERLGRPVRVVQGDPGNVKITTPEDLEGARKMLRSGPGIRVGFGFDVHPFQEGRTLVLGGVTFDGEPGLAGHSDADVVLHAAMDAVLGAAALGDIGVLFPPEDPKFAGASSVKLAAEAVRGVTAAGWEIVNLDLTLLAERPRIRPHHDRMRRVIADCFGLTADRVGLKATTLEKLGALGRSEGIACQAVALLHRRGGDG